MQVFDVDGGKFSVSVDADVIAFVGENGRDASRQAVKVTLWEHFETGRKYQQLMPIATGYSFCQPNDDFDFALGVRQATTRALDQIGYRSNINHVVKKVHQLMKQYIRENGLEAVAVA